MAFQDFNQIKRALREFFFTTLLLGSALLLAVCSTYFDKIHAYQLAVVSAISSLVLALWGGVYIVPKLSKRINLRLFSWRFPFSATTETALIVVITVIVLAAAVNTGNNLLYLIFSVMLAVMLASAIITGGSLRDIDVSLRFPEHIFAQQETLLDLSLINRKRLFPSFSLTVGVLTDDEHENERLLSRMRKLVLGPQPAKGLGKLAHYAILPANGKLSQRISYTFPKRGSYRIKGFLVSTKFPFGFLRKTQEKEALGEVIVYPQPQAIGNFGAEIATLAGWLPSNRRGSSADLYLLRPYVPNDNMRHIDWKATAKSRQLIVREFTNEDERRFSIVIDDQFIAEIKDFNIHFERAIDFAASLADYFLHQNCEFRLLTPDQQTEFGNGLEHFYKILRILALLQPVNETPAQREQHKLPEGSGEGQYQTLEQLIAQYNQDFKIVICGLSPRLPAAASDITIIKLGQL